ncbi:cytochrome c [Gluconobacter oxydans]|uniref:c-type cytochrome n=1 Tax=Gluconobacter oxydans TaxID=442 RepID=UPI001CD87F62|nr:cytochrome c [Gluconobacter oxydans]
MICRKNQQRTLLSIGSALGVVVVSFSGMASASDASLIQKGAYLARAADCAACHTAPGGQPFAGGLALNTPVGRIISTNITPSANHGIGHYSEQDFARAVREGVRGDGANIYPAMPYTEYSAITDQDIHALYVYFHEGVQPVEITPPETKLSFPFNIRSSMAGWNLLFLSKARFEPNSNHNAQWNRGHYLADALEHCGTCHTPRNFLMAEKNSQKYGGTSLGAWFAPNITPSPDGIQSWSDADLKAYLHTGHAAEINAQAAGEMLEAVDKSMSHLSDSDLDALVTYIKSTDPVSSNHVNLPTSARVSVSDPLFESNTSDTSKMSGNALYQAYCASCHQDIGQGRDHNGLPSLVQNTIFHTRNTDNLVMAILKGVHSERDNEQGMPAFGNSFSDAQIASMANALTAEFGDPSIKTTEKRVAELRAGGRTSPLALIAKIGIGLGIAGIVALFSVFLKRKKAS